jgi:dTDP-4-amino-4,6-dideoxygalactose transaminase
MDTGWQRRFNSNNLPVLIPTVPKYGSIKKYLKRLDKSKIYSNFGPLNSELIFRLSNYLGVPELNIQTAANATLALEGAIRTSGSSIEGWEMPSWTFAATPHAANSAGINYKFVDISQDSWRAEFSSNCVNAIDVLPFGDELNLDRVPGKVETIIVDGAASISALRNCGLPRLKNFGLIVSMHATKSLPAGEGAFFVTNSDTWSKKFRQWTNFGFDENRYAYFQASNAKLSEYSAAVALASLDEFDKVQRAIRVQSALALDITESIGLSTHPAMKKGFSSPYWVVKFNSRREKERAALNFKSIGVGVRDWWGMGCHKQKAFIEVPKESLVNTEEIAETTLGLPFHLSLTKSDMNLISNTLKKALFTD